VWLCDLRAGSGLAAHEAMSRVLSCALALACGCNSASAIDPPSRVAIVGESTRYRVGDSLPRTTPWFDGVRVSLLAARGETIGLQIIGRGVSSQDVRLSMKTLPTRTFDVAVFDVKRPSTALYGGSHGRGRYADGLVERAAASIDAPTNASSTGTTVTYIELVIPRDLPAGVIAGELEVGGARYPVELEVADVTLPVRVPRVWAYGDPRELAWARTASTKNANTDANPSRAVPSSAERACIALFREHDVLLSPDVSIDWWPARKTDFAGIRDVPVVISADPAKAGDEVRAWIAATKGTGHVPFAIPIDEPRTPKRIADVVELGTMIRAAGGGPETFRFAVTANPRPEWLGLVDQFIQLQPAARSGAWAYNGLPPWSGAMVLDAKTPGARTWGWIAHRDAIAQWYVWDALYWHDRHNRKGAPLPGRALDLRDPISFDDGEDRGNLDGVLALPGDRGCRPTLRLAALRRGQQDRSLLELAGACDPIRTANVVARTVPTRGWSTDESIWEASRRELIRIASCRR
jgi:hypothetical protein